MLNTLEEGGAAFNQKPQIKSTSNEMEPDVISV